MGDKTRARQAMMAADVPVVPGTAEALADAAQALEVAAEVGYPIMLKAAAGGGGKGMRIVREPAELAAAFEAASREAQSAFGDGSVYIERSWTARGTSRSRCWRTPTGPSSIWASGSARSSGATRR
jgi:acetyl-CoA carboxylase, biotin carboxylase subunit